MLEAVAVVLVAVWFVALVHAACSQARMRARVVELARASADEAPPLAEGAARIAGIVIAPANQVVARTTLEQVGAKQRHKRIRWVDWREVDRRTSVVPVAFTILMPLAYVSRLRALRPWWRHARVQERTSGWPE